MKKERKMTRGEGALLCLTAVFLCVLMGLYRRDLRAASVPAAVETERTEPVEEVQLELTAPGPLDLNEASAEELTGLPGIGEVLAGRIVAWREENGPFPSVEALLEVSGIGEAKLSALEGLVQVK